jgi:hypothetical protein
MQSKIKFFVALATMALLFNSTGCEDYAKVQINVVFTLSNGSGLETHMWVEGESMSQANKVYPGSSRTMTKSLSVYSENLNSKEKVTVYVGRNGAQLGYQEVQLNALSKSVTAFYDGTYLACTVHE